MNHWLTERLKKCYANKMYRIDIWTADFQSPFEALQVSKDPVENTLYVKCNPDFDCYVDTTIRQGTALSLIQFVIWDTGPSAHIKSMFILKFPQFHLFTSSGVLIPSGHVLITCPDVATLNNQYVVTQRMTP